MSKSAISLWIAGIVAFIILGVIFAVQYDKAHPDYRPYEPQEEPSFPPPPTFKQNPPPPVSSPDPMEISILCALNKNLNTNYENEVCNNED